jgi:hypothetical protein
VSRDEFTLFMSQTFDRLDVDKSGVLDRRELRQMTIPNWAAPDCVHIAFPECGGGN